MKKFYFAKKIIFMVFIFTVLFFSGMFFCTANASETDNFVFFKSESGYDLFDRVEIKLVNGTSEETVSRKGFFVKNNTAVVFRVYLKNGYTTRDYELNIDSGSVDPVLDLKNIIGDAVSQTDAVWTNDYFQCSTKSITSDCIIEIDGIIPKTYKATFNNENFDNAILNKQGEVFNYGSTYSFSLSTDIGYHFEDLISVTAKYEGSTSELSYKINKKYNVFSSGEYYETQEVIVYDENQGGLTGQINITPTPTIEGNTSTMTPPGTETRTVTINDSLKDKVKILKDDVNIYTSENGCKFQMAQNETVTLEISGDNGYIITNSVNDLFTPTTNITTVPMGTGGTNYSYKCIINGCTDDFTLNFNSSLSVEKKKIPVGLNLPSEVSVKVGGTTVTGNFIYVDYGGTLEFTVASGGENYIFKVMTFGVPNVVKNIEKDEGIYSYNEPIITSNMVLFAEKASDKLQIKFELDSANEAGLRPSVRQVVGNEAIDIDILDTTVDLPASSSSFKFRVVLDDSFNNSKILAKKFVYRDVTPEPQSGDPEPEKQWDWVSDDGITGGLSCLQDPDDGYYYYEYTVSGGTEAVDIKISGLKTNEYGVDVVTDPEGDKATYLDFYENEDKTGQITDFSNVKITHGKDYSFWVYLKTTDMSVKNLVANTQSSTEIAIESQDSDKVKITLKSIKMDMTKTGQNIVLSGINRRKYNVQFYDNDNTTPRPKLSPSKMQIIEKFPNGDKISNENKAEVTDGSFIEFTYQMQPAYTKCKDSLIFASPDGTVIDRTYSSVYGEYTFKYYAGKQNENQTIVVNNIELNKYSIEIMSDSPYKNKVKITSNIQSSQDLNSTMNILNCVTHPDPTVEGSTNSFQFKIVTTDSNFSLDVGEINTALSALGRDVGFDVTVGTKTTDTNGIQTVPVTLKNIKMDLTDNLAVQINGVYKKNYDVFFEKMLSEDAAISEALKIERVKIKSGDSDLTDFDDDILKADETTVTTVVDDFLNPKDEDKAKCKIENKDYFCFKIIPRYGYDQQLFNNLKIQIKLSSGEYIDVTTAKTDDPYYKDRISVGQVDNINSSTKYGIYCCVKGVIADLNFGLSGLQKNKYNMYFAGDFSRIISEKRAMLIYDKDGNEIEPCNDEAYSGGIITDYGERVDFTVKVESGYDINDIKITAQQEDSTSGNTLNSVDLVELSREKVDTGDDAGKIIIKLETLPILGKMIVKAQLISTIETVRLTPCDGTTYCSVQKDSGGLYTNDLAYPVEEISGAWSVELGMDYKFAVKVGDAYDINTLKAYTNGEEDNSKFKIYEDANGNLKKEDETPVPIPDDYKLKYLIFTIPQVKHDQVVTLSVKKKRVKVNIPEQGYDEGTTELDGVTFLENRKSIARGSQIDVEYGSFFTFTVSLDEKHNQSNLEIFTSGDPANSNKTKLFPSNGSYTIGNITADVYISFDKLEVSKYNVKLTETQGITYTEKTNSNGWVQYGEDFSFKIEAKEGYQIIKDTEDTEKNTVIILKNSDGTKSELLPDEETGIYTIKNIKNDKVITVENVGDVYFTVTLNAANGVIYKNDVGQTISNDVKVKYNNPFEFIISIKEEYDESVPVIKVSSKNNSDVPFSVLAVGRYIIPDIKEDVTIEVLNVKINEYSVYLTPVTGIQYKDSSGKVISGNQTVIHQGTFKFKIILLEDYKDSVLKVMMGLIELTPDKDDIYMIEDIVENKSITVGGVEETKRAELINIINKLPDPLRDYSDVEEVIDATKKFYQLPANERDLPNLDKLLKLQQQSTKWHHETDNITVSDLDWYIKLIVTPITSDMEVCERIYSKLSTEFILSLYDISLWDTLNNRAYTLPEDKFITVTIPTPDMTYFERPIGVHETEDKKVSYLTLDIKGKNTSFSVNSFSPMGIAANRTKDPGRSSLLDAFDANVKSIGDYADYVINTNSGKKSSSTNDGDNNVTNNEDKSEESVLKESGNFSEITPTGNFMRLLLLVIISTIVVICVIMFIKNRDKVSKNKKNEK